MLKVNDMDILWEEGLTVDSLLIKLREEGGSDSFPSKNLIVIINKKAVPVNEYGRMQINDGDIVHVLNQMVGG